MAAEVESMAYGGEVPWHGLGVSLGDETVPPWEILKKASLDWGVKKQAMFSQVMKDGKVDELPILDYFSLIRDVDHQVLGICGKEYQPFQNIEVFDFFNKFTEAGKMKMHIAGSLQNGKYVWALAQLTDGQFKLIGDDINYSYLLMVSPHVWGKSMTIMFTSVRVVCWNTLNMALGKHVTERFRILHNRTFPELKAQAQDIVEQAMIMKQVYHDNAVLLASVAAKKEQVLEYAARLVSPNAIDSAGALDPNDMNDAARKIIYNFEHGPGSQLQSAKGTWWGAFNGVTRLIDFQQGRSGQDKRLYDSWLGAKSKLKVQALELAYEYAKAA